MTVSGTSISARCSDSTAPERGTSRRVKVYELSSDGQWVDRGTGFVQVAFAEPSQESYFVVKSELNELLAYLDFIAAALPGGTGARLRLWWYSRRFAQWRGGGGMGEGVPMRWLRAVTPRAPCSRTSRRRAWRPAARYRAN